MKPVELFIERMKFICPEMTNEEIEAFKYGLYEKSFKKKELLFDQLKPQDHILFITSGLMRSFYIDNKGNQISAWFVKEFDFVSDYPAFLNGAKSNYLFEAIEDITAVAIPKDIIVGAYDASLEFQKFGRLIAEEAVQFLQGRIESLLFKTATERYLEFIEKEPEFFNRLSLEHISTYLGMERQSLTRIRKNLKTK
ncbi:MAG: Crp/Fnr family transcriptional regulator [Flavobacteriales bacterium]|nr:Crp/Fnr family transcriptional regulator [Flavobacteriales bacterium]